MPAAIYARFSSEKQTEESIEAQVRACRDYAAAHGLPVKEIYADEAISGKGSKTAQRRQYQRLLRDAAAVHLLIERIDVLQDAEKEKTVFNVQSTLKTVLRKNGCGGAIALLPKILFSFIASS